MRPILAMRLSLVVSLIVVNQLAHRAFAQYEQASLRVCNNGTVPVEVVFAHTDYDSQDFARGSFQGHWVIEGTTFNPPHCWTSYHGQGLHQEAFIGFGFKDSRGNFVSGTVRDIPDWGIAKSNTVLEGIIDEVNGKAARKALSRANKSVCVRADETFYASRDQNFPTADNCADLSLGGSDSRYGTGRFLPLSLTLNFYPEPQTCFDRGPNVAGPSCVGGDYYMNIAANPADGEVKVTTGTSEGNDAPDKADNPQLTALQRKLMQQFGEALLKAMADRKALEEKQSRIDFKGDYERSHGRLREVAQFSPDWLQSAGPLYVRGTVARVELPVGRQPWGRFYFAESPDGAFVACVYAALFDNLQRYVGQRVEVRGMVGQGRCGAKVADIQVNNPSMVYELAKGTPPDETLPLGMKESTSGSWSSAAAAIPISTRLHVTLGGNVDLQHAKSGDTFQGKLAAPVTLPDGVIPQGSAVVLIHDAWAKLAVYSVAANGKLWRVAAKIDPDANSNTTLSAGVTLVFIVAGTGPPVIAGR